MPAATFDVYGPTIPDGPVIWSVPHAGRTYPASITGALRVPLAALVALEDRHVDKVSTLARRDETLLVQRTARAWIDLNRAESERDPKVDTDAPRDAQAAASVKLRSGLGLVPRQVAGAGALWRRRFDGSEIAARIVEHHRPYHAALAAALASARARFGIAVLLDLHSMPPLGGAHPARFVIGDRFGRASDTRFVARAQAELDRAGWRCSLNSPYAGAHILDRHGDPRRGIHAIQLEIDRSLYLDAALRTPGPGLRDVVRLVRAIGDALADEALGEGHTLAAE